MTGKQQHFNLKIFGLAILFLVTLPLFVRAQDVVEETEDTILTSVSRPLFLINSNLNLSYGNEFDINSYSKALFKLNGQNIGTKISVSYYYEEDDEGLSANEFRAEAQLNILPQNNLFGFVIAGYGHSLLRLHNLRIYGGIGGAYRLLQSEKNKLSPFLAVVNEYTNYISPLLIKGDTIFKRSSYRGQVGWQGFHKLLDDKIVIHHGFVYNQSLQVLNDFRLRAEIGLEFPIFKGLGVEVGATVNYENVVPRDTKNTDTIVYFGVTFSNL